MKILKAALKIIINILYPEKKKLKKFNFLEINYLNIFFLESNKIESNFYEDYCILSIFCILF